MQEDDRDLKETYRRMRFGREQWQKTRKQWYNEMKMGAIREGFGSYIFVYLFILQQQFLSVRFSHALRINTVAPHTRDALSFFLRTHSQLPIGSSHVPLLQSNFYPLSINSRFFLFNTYWQMIYVDKLVSFFFIFISLIEVFFLWGQGLMYNVWTQIHEDIYFFNNEKEIHRKWFNIFWINLFMSQNISHLVLWSYNIPSLVISTIWMIVMEE